jgi:hypothetical protein
MVLFGPARPGLNGSTHAMPVDSDSSWLIPSRLRGSGRIWVLARAALPQICAIEEQYALFPGMWMVIDDRRQPASCVRSSGTLIESLWQVRPGS